MSEVKRVRYFKHEFLNAEDFNVEQNYHCDMRHMHNRDFHTWGICNGLKVDFTPGQETDEEKTVTVSPGTALDNAGKEIVLAESRILEFYPTKHKKGESYYITISWGEEEAEPKQKEGYKRWVEAPVIDDSREDPPDHPEINLVLAKVRMKDDDSGTIAEIDLSDRRYAALELGDKTVTTAKIQDGAVTRSKLNDGSVNEVKLSAATKAKLVTNGNNHNHSGGDGGTLYHSSLKKDDGTNPHGTTAADVGALPITEGANYIRIGDVQLAWGYHSYQNSQAQNLPVTVNLPVSFTGNYAAIVFQRDPDFTGYRKNLALKNQSSNSFVVWSPNGQGTTYYFNWFAVGKWR